MSKIGGSLVCVISLYRFLNLPITVAGMKRWGLRGASVSHEKKHDTGTNATQPP